MMISKMFATYSTLLERNMPLAVCRVNSMPCSQLTVAIFQFHMDQSIFRYLFIVFDVCFFLFVRSDTQLPRLVSIVRLFIFMFVLNFFRYHFSLLII